MKCDGSLGMVCVKCGKRTYEYDDDSERRCHCREPKSMVEAADYWG
jgi:hypothetical protein